MGHEKDNKKSEIVNHEEKPMSFLMMVTLTGLFGGILWSAIGYIAYVFSFTEISPTAILEPWTIGSWKKGWLGIIISIVLMGIISIGVALLYYVMLRKFKSMFVGIGFGLLIFGLVFFVLNPIFPSILPFRELALNTIIASVCLYILYGVFIGYSISYEENESRRHEKDEKEAQTT